MKKYNIGLSAIFLGIASWVFFAAQKLPAGKGGSFGPGLWPQVLAIALAVLSVLLLIQTLVKNIAGQNGRDEEPIDFKSPGVRNVMKMCIILVIFSVLLKFIGFFVAAIFLIPSCMVLFGEKRIRWLSGITVGVTAGVYIIFTVFLRLQLP